MILLTLRPFTEIIHPWPLLVLCFIFLAFVAFCFVSDR
jgi:hypothetical protein